MAEFNAGSVEASLELNRDPFTAGVAAAKAEAKDLEKPIVTPLEAKADLASEEAAKKAMQAAAGKIDIPLVPEVDPLLWARVISAGMPTKILEPIALQLGLDPHQYTLKAELVAAIKLAQAGVSPIKIPVEYNFAEGTLFNQWKQMAQQLTLPIEPAADLSQEAKQLALMKAMATLNPINVPLDVSRAIRLNNLPREALNALAVQWGMDLGSAMAYPTKAALIEALSRGDMGPPAAGGGAGGGGGIVGGFIANLFAGAGASSLAAHAAGFSLGHLILTAIPIAVSFIGAVGGGALLAAGIFGTMAVGMATDAAGIGQAAGDIKTAYTTMSNAALTAAQMQTQLNQQLALLTPAARAAVISAAQTAVGFHKLFDQLTGPAEAVGAQIIQQLILVGEKFLPTIGSFALQNMKIIQAGIQPFLTWLQTQGLSIFIDLEKQFQTNLPAAVHSFTQLLEFIIKTIDLTSHSTDGLVQRWDKFITYWNSTAGFDRWSQIVAHLISDFKSWAGLAGAAVKVVTDFLHLEAGSGQAIVEYLTQGLDKLHAWLNTVTGGATLHTLFEAHKGQILDMIHAIGILLSTVGPPLLLLLTTIAQQAGPLLPVIAQIVAPFAAFAADALNFLLKIPGIGNLAAFLLVMKGLQTIPFIGIGTGFGLLLKPIQALTTALEGLAIKGASAIGVMDLLNKLPGVNIGAAAPVEGEAFTTTRGQPAAGASTGATVGAAILPTLIGGALGFVGGQQLAKYTEPGRGTQARVGRDVTSAGGVITGAGLGLSTVAPEVGLPVAAVGGATIGVGEVIDHWKPVTKFFDDMWGAITGHAHSIFGEVIAGILTQGISTIIQHWSTIEGFFRRLWQTVSGVFVQFFAKDIPQWAGDAAKAITGFFTGIGKDIGNIAGSIGSGFVQFFTKDIPQWAGDAGKAISDFFTKDIPQWAGDAVHAFTGFVTNAAKAIGDFFKPSHIKGLIEEGTYDILTWWKDAGKDLITGLGDGISDGFTFLTSTLPNLAGKLITAMVNGVTTAAPILYRFFTSTLPNAIGNALATAGTWLLHTGINILTGLVHGITTDAPIVYKFFTSTLPSAIGTALVNAGTWLLKVGGNVIHGLYLGITQGAPLTFKFFTSTLPTAIDNAFSAAATWLLKAGGNILSGLYHGITTFAPQVYHYMTVIQTTIVHAFINAATWLINEGLAVIGGLLAGFNKAFPGVGKFFSGLQWAVGNAFAKAGTWLLSAGSAIIGGLINGMADVFKFIGGIGSWIVNNVAKPIEDAVLHFFHIKSPSAVMEGHGQNIIAGLLKGLSSANWLKAAQTIFGGLPQALAAMVSQGVVSIAQLPAEALNALGGLTGGILKGLGSVGGFISSLFGGGGGAGKFASIQALGKSMAAFVGWTGAEWNALNSLVGRESGWNPTAKNPTSSAYGIAQNIGGPAGYGQYGTSPQGQIEWMFAYIKNRYVDPLNAWKHELTYHWYDQGGWLMPGFTLAHNTTGKPERVGAPSVVYAPTYHVTVGSAQDVTAFQAALDEHDKKFVTTFRQLVGG